MAWKEEDLEGRGSFFSLSLVLPFLYVFLFFRLRGRKVVGIIP